MSDRISLQEMLDDAGTTSVKTLFHAINQIQPDFPELARDCPDGDYFADAAAWAKIQDAVAAHIVAHMDRYRVHALPAGKEYIESEEEYAYNRRIEHAVDKYTATKAYGEETQAVRVQRMNEARAGVRDRPEVTGSGYSHVRAAAIDRLAFINNEYWNTAPWETKCAVDDGVADLSVVS